MTLHPPKCLRANTHRALVATDLGALQQLVLIGPNHAFSREAWRYCRADLPTLTHFFIPLRQEPRDDLALPWHSVQYTAEAVLFDGARYPIVQERHCATLAEAIPLIEAPKPSYDDVILFTPSIDALATAARRALQLNLHHTAVATIDHPEAPPHLLRLNRPSLFLLEHWRDLAFPIFYALTERWWIAFPFVHPWAAALPQRHLSSERHTFIAPHDWWQMSLPDFRPLLQQIFVDNPFPTHAATAQTPPRVPLRLRWREASGHELPEVALLTTAELPALEAHLLQASAKDIDNLQMAAIEDRQCGEHLVIIRELLPGHHSIPLGLGQALCAHGNSRQVFLPRGSALTPTLPETILAKHLQVEAGQMVMLLPGPERGLQPFICLRISEAAFQPMTSLIDYLVDLAAERFTRRLQTFRLDLDSPAQALPTSCAGPAAVRRSDPVPLDVAEPEPPLPPPATEKKLFEAQPPAPAAVVPTPEIQPAPNTPVSSALIRAERDAVNHLDDPRRWLKLAQMKAAARHYSEAIDCVEHAIVVAPAQEHPRLMRYRRALLADAPPAAPGPIALRIDAANFASRYAATPPTRAKAFWAQHLALLRERELSLSKRARVLIWQPLLTLLPDPIERARLQEETLRELSLYGIDERDSFPFLRRHLRDEIVEHAEEEPLVPLLAELWRWTQRLSRPEQRAEAGAAIADVYLVFGREEEVEGIRAALAIDWNAPPEHLSARALSMWAAIAARMGRANAVPLFNQAIEGLRKMPQGLEKDQTLLDILHQIRRATLPGTDRQLVLQVLQIVDQHEVQRQAFQLCDAAPVLLEVAAALPAIERCRALLNDPSILEDSYCIENLLRGLNLLGANRTLDAAMVHNLARRILGRAKLDATALNALDLLLTHAPDSMHALIHGSQVAPTDPLSPLLVRSLALRGDLHGATARFKDSLRALLPPQRQSLSTLIRLLDTTSALSATPMGTRLVESTIPPILSYARAKPGPGALPAQDLATLFGACARAALRVHRPDLVTGVINALGTLLQSNAQSPAPVFFGVLSDIFDELLTPHAAPDWGRAIEAFTDQVDEAFSRWTGAKNPYFINLLRLRCALTLIALGHVDAGRLRMQRTMSEIHSIRVFDARDRTDLFREALRIATISPEIRRKMLPKFIRWLGAIIEHESQRSAADTIAHALTLHCTQTMVQAPTAHLLALMRGRAEEERLLRDFILADHWPDEPPHAPQ